MSTTDTRSIGQVLYETLIEVDHGRVRWESIRHHDRDRYERAAEVIYKRGFDAGQANPKAPTPKAKQYRDALKEAVEALRHVESCLDEGVEIDLARVTPALTKAEAVLK